jgi:hypothetical protein
LTAEVAGCGFPPRRRHGTHAGAGGDDWTCRALVGGLSPATTIGTDSPTAYRQQGWAHDYRAARCRSASGPLRVRVVPASDIRTRSRTVIHAPSTISAPGLGEAAEYFKQSPVLPLFVRKPARAEPEHTINLTIKRGTRRWNMPRAATSPRPAR